MSVALWMAAMLGAAPPLELEDALRREARDLSAEREALSAELESLKVRRLELEKTSRTRLRDLYRSLENKRARASDLEARYADSAPEDSGGRNWSVRIVRESEEFPELRTSGEEQERDLGQLFQQAQRLLLASSRLRTESGAFYGPDGRAHSGRIVHVGALGAFGRADQAGLQGPLVQVEGHWSLAQRANVERLFGADEGPPNLPLYRASAVSDATDISPVRRLLSAGGPLAWPILGLGLVVILVALERLWSLSRLSQGDARLEEQLGFLFFAGDYAQAERLVGQRDTGVAAVAQVILRHRHRPREIQAELAESVLVDQVSRAEGRLSLLKLIAAAAPLLGLLGTVIGMIETFDVIAVHGSGDASKLSGGISTALVTTELGLLVAVPTLFVHGALAARVDRIVDRLERVARDLPSLSDAALSEADNE